MSDPDELARAASEMVEQFCSAHPAPAWPVFEGVDPSRFRTVGEPVTVTYTPAPAGCRVYWGTHGCAHPRGHGPEIEHECSCCECRRHPEAGSGCVAKPPYYGKATRFYGEDAVALGLPLVDGAR